MTQRKMLWACWLLGAWALVACGDNGPGKVRPTDPDGSTQDTDFDASVDPDAHDGSVDAGPEVEADADLPDDGGTDAEPARWYESGEPLELTISGPLGDAFRAAFAGTPDGIVPPLRLKDPVAGSIAYDNLDGTEQQAQVALAVRGNSSLQECPFPKLKFAFEQRVKAPADVFFDTKKVKVATHCADEDEVNGTIGRLRNEQAAWREEVAYQLARALGITTLNTRPALIHYTDTSTEPAFESPLTRKAFLLEHVDELARRLGATALQDPVDCGPDPAALPDPRAVLRVRFFHALIGNWDFELGPPETSGCGALRNTEVLVHADGTLTLVPADFDLAAFVVGEVRNPETNQREAITAQNAEAAVRASLAEYLVGESSEAVAAMQAEYLAKKSALHAIVADSRMDAAGKAAGKLLIDGFFAAFAK